MFQDYLFPETTEDAIALLTRLEGKARIIAGGTDLVINVREMEDPPEYYVDLHRIETLNGIHEEDGYIYVGANTTHSQCLANPLIRRHAPVLASACSRVGSTQIRNMGTLAGNIVSANPAADSAVALTALEAVCIVEGASGQREIPLNKMYYGVFRSAVDSSREIITSIKFRIRDKNESSAYECMSRRKALSLPMLCTAVKLRIENNIVNNAVIVAAPLAPGPFRVPEAEEFLEGRPATEEQFTLAGRVASEHVTFRSSPTRGSSTYRHEVLPILIRRALMSAAASVA